MTLLEQEKSEDITDMRNFLFKIEVVFSKYHPMECINFSDLFSYTQIICSEVIQFHQSSDLTS